MRLPQFLKQYCGDGPILFGSPRKLTPRAFKRRYSESMSLVRKAAAGMPSANRAF
jgi:hypothetical protein